MSRVQDQMTAFLDGFSGLVPLPLVKIFDEHELELLMCGIQNIDVKDWKQNTLYKGDYHPNHITVQWFWRVSSYSSYTGTYAHAYVHMCMCPHTRTCVCVCAAAEAFTYVSKVRILHLNNSLQVFFCCSLIGIHP